MSKLLFDEQPLVVIPGLAKLIGLNEAIVLQQIHYWLENNRKAGRHFIDGHTWTYNTAREWHEQFPFWAESTVRKTLTTLRRKRLLFAEQLSPDKRDRTLYYRLNYTRLERLSKAEMLRKRRAEGQMHLPDSSTSICRDSADASSSDSADVYKEQRLASETSTESSSETVSKSADGGEATTTAQESEKTEDPRTFLERSFNRPFFERLLHERPSRRGWLELPLEALASASARAREKPGKFGTRLKEELDALLKLTVTGVKEVPPGAAARRRAVDEGMRRAAEEDPVTDFAAMSEAEFAALLKTRPRGLQDPLRRARRMQLRDREAREAEHAEQRRRNALTEQARALGAAC